MPAAPRAFRSRHHVGRRGHPHHGEPQPGGDRAGAPPSRAIRGVATASCGIDWLAHPADRHRVERHLSGSGRPCIPSAALLAPPNADFPEMGDLLRTLRRQYDKPFALVAYGSAAARWTEEVEGANIPVYLTVRAGMRALAMVARAIL